MVKRLIVVAWLLAGASAFAQAPLDRSKVPVPGPPPELRLPEIDRKSTRLNSSHRL